MKRFRPRLSYANVVATLALFLALSGGVVWAASKITSKQIGKGAVKNKNLAKNAVKAKNLAKNAVTSAKLANGAVTNGKLGDGAVNFAKLAAGTNVIASATSAGPIAAKQDGPVDVPLSSALSVTPVAGQPITIELEARGTLTQVETSTCNVAVFPEVNGNPLAIGELLVLASPDKPPNPLFPNGIPQADIAFPVGLTQPGVSQKITVEMIGDKERCTADSKLDQVAIVATQAK